MNEYLPYLYDERFLRKFDKIKQVKKFVSIVALSWDEQPIEEFTGDVTTGSININGDSAIRRTASLTIVVKEDSNDLRNLNQLFSLNKKVAIYIGFENTTDEYLEYETLWFPQGVFIIGSVNIQRTINSATIGLSLKDKMCLLNGECGGVLPAITVFHEYEEIDSNGNYVIQKPIILDILLELLHHFGGEQIGKIIIRDIDTEIRQPLRWIGSSTVTALPTGSKKQDTFTKVELLDQTISKDTPNTYFFTKTESNNKTNQAIIKSGTSTTLEYGENVGFQFTPFTFPGELVGNAGESVVSILDKIKNALGNYEYFYDVYGNFIFQEKRNFLNTSHSTFIENNFENIDYRSIKFLDKSTYTFDDSSMITSITYTPNYANIKNDFIIWGQRDGAGSGTKIPIRYHLAIDIKPNILNEDGTNRTYNDCIVYTDKDDGLQKVKRIPEPYPITSTETRETITVKDWRTQLLLDGALDEFLGTGPNYYYQELKSEWLKIYDIKKGSFKKEVQKSADGLDAFLDFLDVGADAQKFNVSSIGRRTKVVNDTNINCLFEAKTPNIMIIQDNDKDKEKKIEKAISKGYNYAVISEAAFSELASGGLQNSAFVMVQDMLYEQLSYSESLTLQILPIYHLDPNTRISVSNEFIGVQGDFVIKTMSIPLAHNGTSSLSCARALDKL